MRRLIQIVFVGICAFLGGVAVNLSPRLGASAAPALSVPAARLTATASELVALVKGEMEKAANKGEFEALEQLEKQLVSDRKNIRADFDEKKDKVRQKK